MKNFFKTITNKTFLKALGLYTAILLAITVFGGIYLLMGAWLVSGIFTTTFTIIQFAQANVLAWLATGAYKLWNGVKISK